MDSLNNHNEKQEINDTYNKAFNLMESAKTIKEFEKAYKMFCSIKDVKESAELALYFQRRLEEVREEERIAKKKRKKIVKIIVSVVAVFIVVSVGLVTLVVPKLKYNHAIKLYEAGKYDEAIDVFYEIINVEDSFDKIREVQHTKFIKLYEEEKYDEAISAFCEMNDYSYSGELLSLICTLKAPEFTISKGWNHIVGLKSDGTVIAIGNNDYGQCDVQDWKDIVAISAESDNTVGLKSDGTVVVIGVNEFGQCDVQGWTDIVEISAGDEYTVGLKSDGTVVAVGNNNEGQCNVSDWTNIKIPETK